jgi:hypothetical protein
MSERTYRHVEAYAGCDAVGAAGPVVALWEPAEADGLSACDEGAAASGPVVALWESLSRFIQRYLPSDPRRVLLE